MCDIGLILAYVHSKQDVDAGLPGCSYQRCLSLSLFVCVCVIVIGHVTRSLCPVHCSTHVD